MKFSNLRALAHGAIALLLAACGGGGDGGIGGTGTTPQDVSVGTITAFGSVWVNGVEFESDSATVKRDDDQITHDANNPLDRKGGLRKGMIARVDGSISNSSATTISVDSAVKGRIESITGTTQMVVMGQTVLVDAATVFEDNISLTNLSAGDYVEVHGLVVSGGTISASFIERKTTLADPPFVVRGKVSNHDTAARTFKIGTLTVAVPVGATVNDMPGGLWDNLQVEVKGSACAGTPPAAACGTLTASKVEPDGPQGNVSRIELEGFVTQINANGFNLGSTVVVTTGATFVGGLSSEVVVGSKVEVEGSLSAGVLTATKVSFRENIRFEANVASVNGNTFTLQALNGLTIEANAATRFDKVASVSGLTANNNVRVRARPGDAGKVIATEIELRSQNADTDVRFRAIASAAVDPNLTMLGLTISTVNITQFRDLNDLSISRSAFFNAVGSGGKLVEVRGTQSGATINWNREAQLED